MKWDRGEKYGEIGDPLQQHDEYRNVGSISTLFENSNEEPNPINKDLYVEIDFVDNGCTISNNDLSPVKDIFSKHCIHLHIDLGWNIGAIGGSTGGDIFPRAGVDIDNENWLYFYPMSPRKPRWRNPLINDFYDFKIGLIDVRPSRFFNGGRNGLREDLFHYGISVNCIAQWDGSKVSTYIGIVGSSEVGGDDFILGSTALAHTGIPHYIDRLFMHELGHNLYLVHSREYDGSDLDPSTNPWNNGEYDQGDARLNESVFSTVMYWNLSVTTKFDYLREEWAALDLSRVNDGTSLRYS
jgi:hypothetical protein